MKFKNVFRSKLNQVLFLFSEIFDRKIPQFSRIEFLNRRFFLECFKHKPMISLPRLLSALFIFTQPAIKNFSQRMHFYGQSMGFFLAFALTYIQVLFLFSSKKQVRRVSLYFLLLLISFVLYFNYPSMWYPIVAGFCGYIGLDFLLNIKELKSKEYLDK